MNDIVSFIYDIRDILDNDLIDADDKVDQLKDFMFETLEKL